MTDSNYHQWRFDRYYNEQVDNIIRAYLPLFDAIFKCWTSKKEPGKKE